MSCLFADCFKTELNQQFLLKLPPLLRCPEKSNTCISLWQVTGEAKLGKITYLISLVIRQSLISFQNNSKNLELSYKTDLGLWDCLCIISKFHRTDLDICSHSKEQKTPSYSQINMVSNVQVLQLIGFHDKQTTL